MATFNNPGPIEFDAIIHRSETVGSGAFVHFPGNVDALFGVTGRVPVTATIDGEPYRGSLVRYGGPHMLVVVAEIRERIGKQAGDVVHVWLQLDTRPRTVDLDDDIESALRQSGVLDRFRGFSYSHQRELARWIEEAKRAETRTSRIARAVEMVREGTRLS